MPIDVTIKQRPGLKDYNITWSGSSDEAHKIWDECEVFASNRGLDAITVAEASIQSLYKHGEPKGATARRGLLVWIAYAVLYWADKMKPAEASTVFDLAEHQLIRADMQLDKGGKVKVDISGRSLLDS